MDERDDRWVHALRQDVMNASVDLECDIARFDLTLRDIVDLKAGDIIPVQIPDLHVMTANRVPMFRTEIGQSNENLAMKIVEFIDRSQAHSVPKVEEKNDER